MTSRQHLADLTDAFHGRLPAAENWSALLDASNRALITPSLARSLSASGIDHLVPAEPRAFLHLIESRNDERNIRLRDMARDAVHAMNHVGITPVLLKGMAVWASRFSDDLSCPRMMSDVDLLIEPYEGDAAIEALIKAGFNILRRYPQHSPHVIAEFWREGDVGVLDLHKRPPGVPTPPDLASWTSLVHRPWLGHVRLPSPAHQIYLTCMHDQFHDGGFWKGGFDLRHLLDIANLATGEDGVDWRVVRALGSSRLIRLAVESQLIAAHQIVGAKIPGGLTGHPWARLHYRRLRVQYDYPRFYAVAALFGAILRSTSRQEGRTYVKGGGRPGARDGAKSGLLSRVARVLRVPDHPNKI